MIQFTGSFTDTTLPFTGYNSTDTRIQYRVRTHRSQVTTVNSTDTGSERTIPAANLPQLPAAVHILVIPIGSYTTNLVIMYTLLFAGVRIRTHPYASVRLLV